MGIITIKTVYFFNSTNQRNRLSSFFLYALAERNVWKDQKSNMLSVLTQSNCLRKGLVIIWSICRESMQPLIVSKTRCWLYNRKSFLKIFIFVYHQKIKLLYKTETTKETINNSLKPQILTHKTRRHFIEVACVKVKNLFFQVLKSGWPSGKHSALYLD